jgi:hypothetical protein
MASEHSQEDQSLATQVHNPPTSREESIRLETTGGRLTNFSLSTFDGLNKLHLKVKGWNAICCK